MLISDIDSETMISEAISGFNFPKVAEAMKAVGWRYGKRQDDGRPSGEYFQPEAIHLRETAIFVLREAIKCRGTVRTGGFEACFCEHDEEPLILAFVFEVSSFCLNRWDIPPEFENSTLRYMRMPDLPEGWLYSGEYRKSVKGVDYIYCDGKVVLSRGQELAYPIVVRISE